MDLNIKHSAQRRADRITAFRDELAELEREQGLTLTLEQRARLEAHLEGVLATLNRQHGIDITESSKRFSWGIRLVTLLGMLAFVAALVLFLHRIWGALPPFAYAPVLAAPPLLFLAAAEYSFRKGLDPFYVTLLGLAAGAAFVMELNALGNVFNLSPSPHVLLAWSAFAILVAYVYEIRLLLGAGLVLFCAYTAALLAIARGSYWGNFPDQGFNLVIPAAAALYALPSLGTWRDAQDFGFIYRFCGAGLTLLALLVMSQTGDLCCSGLSVSLLTALYQLAGLGLSVGVLLHGLSLGKGGLVNLGAVAFVVFLFVRLHAWWWNWMPKYLFFLSLSLIALLLLVLFRRIRARLEERRGI